MRNRRKQTLCLVMSVLYAFSLLLAMPIQANAQAVLKAHHVAGYTKAQKTKATNALVAALSELPSTPAEAMEMTSADLKKLIDVVNSKITTARKMKLSYTYFKNYDRLDLAKTAYTTLIEKEKEASTKATEDQVKAKAVSDMIAALPLLVTKADQAKVALARTAYMGLSIEQMKLVTNLDTLVAAEKQLGDLMTASILSVEPYKVDSIRIRFTNVPGNYVNVTFTVTKDGNPIIMTPEWADGRLEVVLSTPSGISEGTYQVNVKDGDRDMGTRPVTFEKQKVAKILFTPPNYIMGTTSSGTKRCYATYKVYDQYGLEITNSDIASNLRFTASLSGIEIERRNGVIAFSPTQTLMNDRRLIVYAVDEASGTNITVTLTEAALPVIIRDLNLRTVTNKDGKLPTAGDTSTVYYIKYSAVDATGNDTKDLKMLQDSTIFIDPYKLTVSSPMVRAELVEDPDTPFKGAIKLTVIDGSAIPMDLPITVTMIVVGGKAASMTFYLKKGN